MDTVSTEASSSGLAEPLCGDRQPPSSKDGRIGIFREGKGYGGTAKCESGEQKVGSYDGYAPLVEAVVRFFKSGRSPVDARETLEIYAFMQAADESKAANGREVPLKLDWE